MSTEPSPSSGKTLTEVGTRLLPPDIRSAMEWDAGKVADKDARRHFQHGWISGYLNTYCPDEAGPFAAFYRLGYDMGAEYRELLISLRVYRKLEWSTPELREVA